MIASGIEPSAIAGRIRCLIASTKGFGPTRDQCVDQHEARVGLDVEAGVDPARGREPVELGAEDPLERQPEDEDRDADAEEREDRDGAVGRALDVPAREAPKRDPEADGEEEGEQGQLDGARKPRQEVGCDRGPGDDARAEVTAEQLAEIEEVLLVQRLVEAEGLPDSGNRLGGRVLAEDGPRRVARQEVDEREQDDRQPEQDRDGRDESPDDVLQHDPGPTPLETDARCDTTPGRSPGPGVGWIGSGRRQPAATSSTAYLSSQTELISSVRLPAPTKPFT